MINRDMNFFVHYEGQKKEQKNKNIYIYSLVAFLLLVIIGTFAYNTVSIVMAKQKIKFYEEELAKEDVQKKLNEYEGIVRQYTSLANYETQVSEIIEVIESRQVIKTEVLNKVSGTIPSEVTINGIIINKNDITIKAVSNNRIAIGEFEHNLRNLDITSDVYIGSIAGDEIYTFDVKCYLREVN